jgi:hypothetical protein
VLKINKEKSFKVINSLILAFSIFSCSTSQINNIPVTTQINKYNSENKFFRIKYSPDFNSLAYYLAYSDIRQQIKDKTIPDVFYHYFYNQSSEAYRMTNSLYLEIKSRLESKEWSEEAYLIANPDVKSAIDAGSVQSGYAHWYEYAQANEPSRITSSTYIELKAALDAGFNETAYRLAWSDIDNLVKNNTLPNAYTHYNTWAKNNEPHRIADQRYLNIKSAVEQGFDEETYLRAYPDIKSAVTAGTIPSGLEHCINYGMAEGRLERNIYHDSKLIILKEKIAVEQGFNEDAYLLAYPDIKSAVTAKTFKSGLDHCINYGMSEGRLTRQIYIDTKLALTQGFDDTAYLLAYPDVKSAITAGTIKSAIEHCVNSGLTEGRLTRQIYLDAKLALSLNFNEARYRFAYPDVANAIFNGSLTSAFQHFSISGKDEGRLTSQAYLNTSTQEKVVNEFKTNAQANPSIAMDSSGNYMITWISIDEDGESGGIFGQRFSSLDGKIGAEFRINQYTTGEQFRPSITMNSSGRLVVVWDSNNQDASGFGIFARIYNSDTSSATSEFQVNTHLTNNQYNPAAAMDSNGNFVVTWQSDNQDGNGLGIYAQRFDSLGNSIDSEFKINTYTISNQVNPAVAMDSNGNFIVTWQSLQDGSGYGIYAQKYDSNGIAQGSEFRVNNYTRNNQRNPSVSIDSSGNFVVTWQSDVQDGSGFGIYAQRYNSSRQKVGSEFRVNSYTTNFQENSSVSMDSSGNFVVTWQSNGQDGDGYGVYYQKYNSNGAKIGFELEYPANIYTTNAQYNPVVVLDNLGNFVIAWQSYTQDGSNNGIYTKRYIT